VSGILAIDDDEIGTQSIAQPRQLAHHRLAPRSPNNVAEKN
jgi:hypothetical protein